MAALAVDAVEAGEPRAAVVVVAPPVGVALVVASVEEVAVVDVVHLAGAVAPAVAVPLAEAAAVPVAARKPLSSRTSTPVSSSPRARSRCS